MTLRKSIRKKLSKDDEKERAGATAKNKSVTKVEADSDVARRVTLSTACCIDTFTIYLNAHVCDSTRI